MLRHGLFSIFCLMLCSSANNGTAPPAQSTAAPSSAAPSSAAPAPAADAEAVHEHHYHPAAAAVTTKTFVVPSGHEISVRAEETIDSAKAVEGQTYAAEV